MFQTQDKEEPEPQGPGDGRCLRYSDEKASLDDMGTKTQRPQSSSRANVLGRSVSRGRNSRHLGAGVPQGTAGLEQSKQLQEAGQSRGPWNGGGLSVC